ncbi:MAG: efflux RND transporter periplasmic adaptor subunit [Pseudomonadota bacterium]
MSSKGKRVLIWVAGLAALFAIVLYSAGVLTPGKVPPGREAPPAAAAPAAAPATATAERVMVPEVYEATGSVRPLTEISLAAQVPARIQSIAVRAGAMVQAGQVLAVLDDAQFRARLEQARQGLRAAQAGLERARSEQARVQGFAAAQAATPQQLEQAVAAFRAAEAGAKAAAQAVTGAEIALGYTQVKAPSAGQVVRRLAEPGDLALPGRPLLILQSQGRWRLEALVREGLIGRVQPGQKLRVALPALGREVEATVAEVAPAADQATRSFVVKADLAPAPDLNTGMFGRLLVAVGERPAVLAPRAAVMHIGQLEAVRLREGDGWRRVYVRTGRMHGERVEVLSGLRGGEELALGSGDDA